MTTATAITTLTTSAAKLTGRFDTLDRSRIRPSKTNPRKTFDGNFIKELSVNIGEHGLAMLPLVRPVPPDPDFPGTDHEIVAGEQRFRATGLLDWKELPVYIRELTDKQALEIQVIENLKRKDLHPLEEAEGFEQLMKKHGYTVDTLADEIKHSKAYIYASLKLLALCDGARKSFLAGKVIQSVALLIARIPSSKLQIQAIEEVGATKDRDAMSARNASAHIQRNFMTNLKDAPFDKKKGDLLPKVGACTNCPKRSGNAPELFSDVQGADVCTDTACFSDKRRAWSEIQLMKAKEANREVIEDPKKAKEIFPHQHSRSSLGKGFKSLDTTCYDDPKYRTFGQLAKAAGINPTVVLNPYTGDTVEVIRESDAKAAMKEAGIEKKPANAAEKAAIKRAQIITKYRTRALEQISEQVAVAGPTLEDWKFVAFKTLCELDNNNLRKWIKQLEWDISLAAYESRAALKAKVESLDAGTLASLIFRTIIFPLTQASSYWNVEDPQALKDICDRYQVSLTKLKAEATREEASAAKAKKPAAKANAAKKVASPVTKPTPAVNSKPKVSTMATTAKPKAPAAKKASPK